MGKLANNSDVYGEIMLLVSRWARQKHHLDIRVTTRVLSGPLILFHFPVKLKKKLLDNESSLM